MLSGPLSVGYLLAGMRKGERREIGNDIPLQRVHKAFFRRTVQGQIGPIAGGEGACLLGVVGKNRMGFYAGSGKFFLIFPCTPPACND